MKKYKLFLTITITFLIFIFLNLGYYFMTNWQSFFPKKASPIVNQIAELEVYNNPQIGFEVKYPPGWIVKEHDNTVEISPADNKRNVIYFSVGLRDDFKSLDDVKRLLPNTTNTPIQISGADGFQYKDTDDHESTWVYNSKKIYIIRTYSIGEDANKILASLKFI